MIELMPNANARPQSTPIPTSQFLGFGRPLGAMLVAIVSLSILAVGVAWAQGYAEYASWWLTNRTPPNVTITTPVGVVRGTIAVGLSVVPDERAQAVGVELDGRSIAVAVPLVIDTSLFPDGPHRLSVTVQDASWAKNLAVSDIELVTDNTPPRLTLEARSDEIRQGGTWLFRVRSDEPTTVRARIADAPLELHPSDGFAWAIVGIPPDSDTGDLQIVVEGTDIAGNLVEERLTMRIAAAPFDRERVTVPERLLPLLQPEVRAKEDARLAPIYAGVSHARLWDGPFIMPVQGEVVTRFGEVRSYNGNPFEGHHAGIDITAPAGRPVVAPARGRVAHVSREPLRGNMLVLDHGLGVFTTYAHLSAIDVQLGQEVERGQRVATVGSTGLSEGPHLHWELWVRQVNVDPVEWTRQRFP
jgi:murein DD-endopeptidase MepM/ murein hydrolase activator NlpD